MFVSRLKTMNKVGAVKRKAINKNIEYVKSETLSDKIQFNVKVDGGSDVIFDKLKTKIFITKV